MRLLFRRQDRLENYNQEHYQYFGMQGVALLFGEAAAAAGRHILSEKLRQQEQEISICPLFLSGWDAQQNQETFAKSSSEFNMTKVGDDVNKQRQLLKISRT